jgi:hypothetical protein
MYDFPELAQAHERLRDRFHARMSAGAPYGEVELTQICGYPLITSLSGAYAVIGAPVYDLPLSRPSAHRGLVVVATDSTFETIDDLRGARFAYNALDSNTGTNLPRGLFAPLSRDGRFFSETIETGSHLESLPWYELPARYDRDRRTGALSPDTPRLRGYRDVARSWLLQPLSPPDTAAESAAL